MSSKSLFEKDFAEVEDRFPKLNYSWNAQYKTWVIAGELDICDIEGIYWITFNIAVAVPQGYPYCVPVLLEKSEVIPREIDWHISPEGICCIDVSHNLIVMSKVGINICDFISDKIYPYFANQLYKLSENEYAGGEYAHHLDGVIQYYIEEHQLRNEKAIISLLERIVAKIRIGRNDKCPCESGKKVKYCHLQSIETIKTLGMERVKADMGNIKTHIELSQAS